MKHLGEREKILLFGGAAKGGAKKTTTKTGRKPKTTKSTSKTAGAKAAVAVEAAAVAAEAKAKKPPKPKAKTKKKEAKLLTKMNDNFYNAGQISVAAFSVAEHFNYSIPKLMSAVRSDEDSFNKHSIKEPKLLRPNFRFSRNYWHSSISYGTPG